MGRIFTKNIILGIVADNVEPLRSERKVLVLYIRQTGVVSIGKSIVGVVNDVIQVIPLQGKFIVPRRALRGSGKRKKYEKYGLTRFGIESVISKGYCLK